MPAGVYTKRFFLFFICENWLPTRARAGSAVFAFRSEGHYFGGPLLTVFFPHGKEFTGADRKIRRVPARRLHITPIEIVGRDRRQYFLPGADHHRHRLAFRI